MRSPMTARTVASRSVASILASLLVSPLLIAGGAATLASMERPRAVSPLVVDELRPVAATTVKVRLRAAVKNLRVATETTVGYQRSKYRHWIDANGDCQDTRDEVLAAESRANVGGCDLRTGRWFSYYDHRTWTHSADVDIDHLVPLKESWDSGGKGWNADTRTRYANDLLDRRALVAVTDNVNQSKSDRDPKDWMPRYGKCRYIREWTAVKTRWKLKVDQAEKTKLTRVAANCRNVVLTVTKAKIVLGGSTSSGDQTSYPPVSAYDCPSNAPIKGNESSMIYHPPDSPWYDGTTPEQCFATEAGAQAAGFRRAIY